MNKKLLLTSLLAIAALVGCGNNGGNSSVVSTPASSEPPTQTSSSASSAAQTGTTTVADANSLLAKYDFTGLTETNPAISGSATNDDISQLFANVISGQNIIASYSDVACVYNGNGKGGAKEDQFGLVKMGTSSKQGKFTLTLNAGVTVSKVVVNCHSFYALSDQYPNNSNFLKVNDVIKAAPYNATAAGEDLIFDVTASNTITFASTNSTGTGSGRVVLYSIALYA